MLVNLKRYQLNQVLSSSVDSAFFGSTTKKEHRRAFYTEQENSDNSPVHLLYIDIEMLGQ